MIQIRSKVFLIRKELQSILDTLEPIALIDRNSTILRVNTKFSNLVRKNFREVVGCEMSEDFKDFLPPHHKENLKRVLKEECSVKVQKHRISFKKTKDNKNKLSAKELYFDIEYFPIKLLGQDRVLIIWRNLTELYDSQFKLERNKKNLEEVTYDLQNKNLALQQTQSELQKNLDERLEELNYAREIQEGLIPQKIEIPGVKSWLHYEPIQSVGGDFYDVIPINDHLYGLFVSDVAGHGLAAAFVGALAKMSLTVHAPKAESPKRLMNILNTNLCSVLNSGHYLTAFYGIFDINDNSFTYTRASHPAPVLRRANGQIETLDTKGLFAGIFPEPKYEERRVYLKKGDRLFFFTDGIFEIVEDENTKILYSDFVEILTNHAHRPLDEVLIHSTNEITKRIGVELNNEDDITFIALEIEKESKSETYKYLTRYSNKDTLNRRKLYNFEDTARFLQDLGEDAETWGFSEKVVENLRESLSTLIEEFGSKYKVAVGLVWSYELETFKISLNNYRLEEFDQHDLEQGLFLAKTYFDDVKVDNQGRSITLIKKKV
jgi:serine phosphatase RsbU (regulator of sigma subunit)